MGIPENTDTIEKKISSILNTITEETDDGKKVLNWDKLEEDISEELKYAVISEKRRRDTQAEYTRTRQQLKLTQAEREALLSLLPSNLVNLTDEQLQELEELKYEDPDKWRIKVNELEKELAQQTENIIKNTVNKKLEELTQKEIDSILDDFNKNNDKPITKEMLELDIPLRLQQEIKSGKISFEEGLKKAYNFIYNSTINTGVDTLNQPNLGEVGKNSGGVKTRTSNIKEEIF